ncbi:hypothetical protein MAHJHV29_20370 [Mycobacterium avium subsp. hominissuis]
MAGAGATMAGTIDNAAATKAIERFIIVAPSSRLPDWHPVVRPQASICPPRWRGVKLHRRRADPDRG